LDFILSREGQVTDRYMRAVTLLGDEKLDVPIGGIYALERVARDSAKDYSTVIEVLSAFIREHSQDPHGRRQRPSLDNVVLPSNWLGRRVGWRLYRWLIPEGRDQERTPRPDVQAALTVVGRRDTKRDIRPINVCGANLSSANLVGANLRNTNLSDTNLRGANLSKADLTNALLWDADLRGAVVSFAKLQRAKLGFTHLERANFSSANLRGAELSFAHLSAAILAYADLTGADLTHADLTYVRLAGATLARANFADASLRGAKLRSAIPELPNTTLLGANLVRADLDTA
jgi:uncharacterized protein YjbI with pentapeptide repeats